jgi:hypothetical protein
VFSVRSVSRCYKQEKLGAAVGRVQSVTRVGGWCEVAASLGVIYETLASR